jgi:predicted NBD/HSP70 family sugar kinase
MNQFLLGMDVGGTRIKAALFTPELALVQEMILPTEAMQGPKHVIQRMKESVNTLIYANALASGHILGMGIGFPGLLDPQPNISLFVRRLRRRTNKEKGFSGNPVAFSLSPVSAEEMDERHPLLIISQYIERAGMD